MQRSEVAKSGFSRGSGEPICCVHEREYHFKELTHVVVEANKSKICMMGQQAKGPGRATLIHEQSAEEFLLSWDSQPLFP